ncbi:hypothetical protein [Prevotellamassilia timonensis]|uniref:hypothetical protein n=1 Tax=Prevotellamassilia timonensis TaxID=1852370 RepID=UPI003A8CCB51
MTSKEIQILVEIENLVCDFDNHIEMIKDELRGLTINLNFGQQLIYADVECSNSRQRRMLLFDIMLHESANLMTDWVTTYYLLKEAYIMTDNIYAQLCLSPYSFNLKDFLRLLQQKVNVEQLMEQEEKDYLNALSFPLKIYRGMCNAEADSKNYGISWTDSKDYASNYVFYSKNNNQNNTGAIVEMVIEKKDVFAAWGEKGKKKELIILT